MIIVMTQGSFNKGHILSMLVSVSINDLLNIRVCFTVEETIT